MRLALSSILPLDNHAEVLVVQTSRRQILRVQHGELLNVHDEDPSPSMSTTSSSGRAAGPMAAGNRTLRTQTARRQPVARLVKLVLLRRPHLVLTDARGDDHALRHLARARSPPAGDGVADLLRNGNELLALDFNLRAPLEKSGKCASCEMSLFSVFNAGRILLKMEQNGFLFFPSPPVDVDVPMVVALGEFRQLTSHAIVESHAERADRRY